MTDEERAEEWVRNNGAACLGKNMDAYEFAEEAYLAGLKAGRPKWRKVADGDLPDDMRLVWTNVGAGCYSGEDWYDDFSILNGVVVWCEPKFEEEEA